MKKYILAIILFVYANLSIFSQMTIWNNAAFRTLSSKSYNDLINQSQTDWNNEYCVVGIDGEIISDSMLRTYLFSYMNSPSYAINGSEIDDIYEKLQDFVNGHILDETIYCYFYDENFDYIVLFTIHLKKGNKIIVKQDATLIPIKK